MKYFILLLIVVGGIWWIKQQRASASASPKKRTGPQIMVPCAHCGTHIPENEASRGTQGLYCSNTHRDAHEG